MPLVTRTSAWIVLLCFLGAGFFPFQARAQANPEPAPYVLDVQGLSLSEALSRTADLAGIDLAYAPELVIGKTSTCVTRTASVEALLRCVLEGSRLEAHPFSDTAYLIRRIREARPSQTSLTTGVIYGTVRSDATDDAIPGAHVLVKGTLLGDATDAQGRYVIERVPAGSYALAASGIGFGAASHEPVDVPAGDTVHIAFVLDENPLLMDELTVIAGYDRFTHTLARQIPIALQSIHVFGVGLGLLVNANPDHVSRFQVSGLGNLAGTELRGVQASGGVNYTGGGADGAQLGGLGNQAGARLRGVQAGGVFNSVRGNVHGAQLGGATNVSWASVTGVQAAGAVNAAGKVAGVQAAGALNAVRYASGVQVAGAVNLGARVHGFQAAGFLNVARSVRGVQVAGFLNIARSVRGVQIGVVNITRESSGVPIGLFNFVRDAGLGFDVWTDETGLITTAVRSGTRSVSTFLGGGVRPRADAHQWALFAGLGVEQSLSRHVQVGLDALHYTLSFVDNAQLIKLRLVFGYRPVDRFMLFAGPTYNGFLGDESDGHDLAPWSHYHGRRGTLHYRTWPGFVAGLRLSLFRRSLKSP